MSKYQISEDVKLDISSIPKENIALIEIISPSVKDFNDTVKYLRDKNIANDQVVFSHRPINPTSGKPLDSTVAVFQKEGR